MRLPCSLIVFSRDGRVEPGHVFRPPAMPPSVITPYLATASAGRLAIRNTRSEAIRQAAPLATNALR